MSQYQGIFQRYEKKYLLSRTQYQNLSRKLESHMREDQYGKSTICNIYYDTPDHRLIRESLEKPIYKEKLRLRSYSVPKKEDIVFVEMMRYIMCWRATHRFVPIRTSYSAVRNCRLKRHTP